MPEKPFNYEDERKKIQDEVQPKPAPKGETVTVDEMLRRNGVDTSARKTAPVAPSPKPSTEAPSSKNGAFLKNGKWLYKYDIDGDTLILPKPIEQMSEQDFYDMPVALMDNNVGRLPTNLTVKFKDAHWAGYWFNKKANSGARIGTGKALGFIPAKCEDLEWYPAHLRDTDGALEQGDDLVLMKIHKARLYMYYKLALDRAKREGGVQGYKNQANRVMAMDKQGRDPYYVAAAAEQEFQGVGEVAPIGEGGKLIIQQNQV